MGSKVCILTTVHPAFDTRIFHKQAKTLVQAGYDVTLVAQHDKDEVVEGVRILALPRPRNRLTRMVVLTWQAFRLARRERADVYHFHDPELLEAGLLLKLRRKAKVIYDVHEDYVTSVRGKTYLPRWARPVLAQAVRFAERPLANGFSIIVAERYYLERFPNATPVLNYPMLASHGPSTEPVPEVVDAPRALYTGNVTRNRGALIHAGLVGYCPGLHIYMVGRCSPAIAAELRRAAGPAAQRVHLEGEGGHVPHERIAAYYRVGGWVAGLALFPYSSHYARKELTKFFEYMAAGIPLLVSRFPVWQDLVAQEDCGLAVDPGDYQEIGRALHYLLTHPEDATRMGQNGRRAVEERYNWETEGAKLLRLYGELACSRGHVAE